MRSVVEDCLLGSGQLMDLDHPVDFYDEQRASANDSILGWLESLQHRSDVLQQGCGNVRVLGLDEMAIGYVFGSNA
jgi:hypothetical protein